MKVSVQDNSLINLAYRSEVNRRANSTNLFPIPIVVVSGRWLVVARLRTCDAIPIDPAEARMPIDKTQDIFRVGIRSVDEGMPRTSEKCRPRGCEHAPGRIPDGTEGLAC